MRPAALLVLTAAALGDAVRAQAPPSLAAGSTLLKASRTVDVVAGVYRANHAVLVSNGRIVQIGPAAEVEARAPAGTMTIDLGAATLLPGLIDSHAHVLASMDGGLDGGANIVLAITQAGPARRALLGAAHARELLQAGFTTVRNVGHSGVDGDMALRDAIEAGSVPGPRVLASGRKITPPGGQAVTLRLPDAGVILSQEFLTVSGAAEARRAAAELIAAGVDVIKIVTDANRLVMDREDVAAIVDMAHRAGLRVAAHATTAAGIQAAIDGGVDSIEHGDEATDAMLTAMREKRIVLVPVAWTAEALKDVFLSSRAMTPAEQAGADGQIAAYLGRLTSVVQRAMKAGVTIAGGSDMWTRYPGKTRGQATKTLLHALVRCGMSPGAAIRAATSDAALLLGWRDRIGTLEAGRFADIIAVHGDPLSDIAALDSVVFVMRGGIVVTQPSR